ncbi:MAG: hypothetical protein HQ542_10145 [Bacteroidia bacterium]|nr:hypothetical protein [Bacteroidia bacterium]
MKWHLLMFLGFCSLLISCRECSHEEEREWLASSSVVEACAVDTADLPCGIDDLFTGDIIVRANNNWLPGSAFVPGGYTFGHAAIVIRGAHHPNTDSLLARVLILESNSRDVVHEDQVRIVPGYYVDPDPDLSNRSFGHQYTGIRYRLRIPLSNSEQDSLAAWLLRQDPCGSSWRVLKNDHSDTSKGDWYCTLLIRAVFQHVKGIDLDANQGWVVYPNDLIASPWFDNKEGERARRTRF